MTQETIFSLVHADLDARDRTGGNPMTPEITSGAKVFLRSCPHGEPGTVVKVEHGRAVIYWHDLDFLARHKPESLLVIESGSTREMEAAS